MHDILRNEILNPPFNLRIHNRPSRRGGLQIEIPRVKFKVGKESVQYRGLVIWNYINMMVSFNVNVQKTSVKILCGGCPLCTYDSHKRPRFQLIFKFYYIVL